MPVPRLNVPKHKLTERGKMSNVVIKLNNIGYDVDDPRSAIKIIENDNLDKSQFDFPYGSFEETKKRVLAGEFDCDEKKFYISDERRKQVEQEMREGKGWTY